MFDFDVAVTKNFKEVQFSLTKKVDLMKRRTRMKENIIVFDRIETYPQKLLDYLETLNPEEQSPKVDVSMIEYIKSFNTYLYHCTKLKNKNDILVHGIKRIAFYQSIRDEYIRVLKIVGDDPYDFEKWVNDYKYTLGRGTTVHTTGTLDAIIEDGHCLPFFECFGGEILTEIIKDNLYKIIKDKKEYDNVLNNYKEKLSQIGKPYIVEIVAPVSEAVPLGDYESFFGQICRFYKKYSSEFIEQYIPNISKCYKRDILPSEINVILDVSIKDGEIIIKDW